MRKIPFNDKWLFEGNEIDLPHDAMLNETRSVDNLGGVNIGFFNGGIYHYEKFFFIPEEYRNKKIIFEFEGVYKNAEVYLNDKKAAYWPFGYGNYYVNADSFLKYGQDNRMLVIANNDDQPNSRWYSGSGIYRPVNMFVLPEKHIQLNGVKIKTLEHNTPCIRIDVKTNAPGLLNIEILSKENTLWSREAETEGSLSLKIELASAQLWDAETPNLYRCRISFGDDIVEENFGIRSISWNREKGFCINGKRTILRGACIHHDNGLLGARANRDAEYRKIRILKESGYNAIRSAHNPCSKAMLKACDELGMYVMDEYTDVWYIHKTKYDYSEYMGEWWPDDLKNLVEKDFNHPSVVLYSTGNEVSETAQERGIKLTGEMTEYLHLLDDTRPVSCGINIFFNYLSSIGFGVYSDKKANKKKKQLVGSEFFNKLAGLLGDKTMKWGATLRGCDIKTRDAFSRMDIAGYNYGILRYIKDLRKYPDRLILGSETFCKDAYSFWEMAKLNKRIVGDFVWAGMDYLGEAGIGAWEYNDYAPVNGSKSGWLTAGSGRIDITGKATAEAAYTKVAFEQEKGPLIAVKPVYQRGPHSPSAWKMTEAIESWSWGDYSGTKTRIEVYARAAYITLLINGKKAGKKKINNDCKAIFNARYEEGEITAIAYNAGGEELGKKSLVTANKETCLTIEPEQSVISPGALAYIRFRYTDSQAILKPMEKHILHVEVKGGSLLGLGNGCSYNPEGYGLSHCKTYYGEALAIVQASNSKEIVITVSDEKRTVSDKIQVSHLSESC